MARFLRDLLDAEEPLFSQSIAQLERITANSGADVKLIGDITERAHESLRKLGLDPVVSTGAEVYQALHNRIEHDARRLTKIIGASEADDVRHLVPFMIKRANIAHFDKRVFVLKREKAKELIAKMPPKKLIKHLGYESLDQMLENEDFDEIYSALRFSEGSRWLNEYNELFKHVTADDFEMRNLRIIAMDHEKYVDLADDYVRQKHHNVTHTKEMGTVVVVPMKARRVKAIILKTLPLLFHYMNEVKLYSSFFKLNRRKPDLGKLVVETLIEDPSTHGLVAGHNIHWRVIQRHFSSNSSSESSVFEPHLEPQDLLWRRAEDLLYDLDPELEFWKGRDYVAIMYDGFPVSFNLFDVCFSYANEEPYEKRYAYRFRESLWNEVFARYMGFKNLEMQVLDQLNTNIVKPETLTPPKLPRHVQLEMSRTRLKLEERKKLLDEAEGRLLNVSHEFKEVFDVLEKYDKTVTVFGSARIRQDDPFSQLEYKIAMELAKDGYAVVTGGGHGLMEAANHGAFDAGGDSVGFNIILPTEQTLNAYTTDNYEFGHFFGRKVAMTIDASAYIYMPGGFGTFDELFEVLTLIQTRRMPKVPVILVGSKFWKPFDRVIRKVMLEKFHTIHADDMKLYKILDKPQDILRIVNYHYSRTKLATKAISK